MLNRKYVYYTCSTNHSLEPDFTVYNSKERLKADNGCWEECGISKVIVIELRNPFTAIRACFINLKYKLYIIVKDYY
tara:strand:+ start:388 stop:618 length:231 start_codon:yes stop_codon:yes gene_type:complete